MRPVSFLMSPAKPLRTPTSPPTRHPISPTPPPHFRSSLPNSFVTSLPHSSALPQNGAPLFQYLTHSSQFTIPPIPFVFLTLRTLCQKHPGVVLVFLTKFWDSPRSVSQLL